MNPLDVPATILRMVDLITGRAAPPVPRSLAAPPGVTPMGARPRQSAPAPIRRITEPATAGPAPVPVVTALPSPGVGTAPPAIPVRATGGPSPLLTGTPTLDFLAGEPGAAEFDWNAPLPVSLPSPGDVASGAVAALDAPGAALFSLFGEEGYQYALGNRGVYDVQARTGADPFLAWVRENPEEVRRVHDDGYLSRDGTETFTGGRAVWERYARDHPEHAAAARLVGDPLNLVGGPAEAIGKGVTKAGVRLAAKHPDDLLLLAGKGIEFGGRGLAAADAGYQAGLSRAGDALGSLASGLGNRARQTPGVDRVAAQVGRWFEASPWALARRNLNETLAARARRDAARARGGGLIPDPNGVSPGVQTSPATIASTGVTPADAVPEATAAQDAVAAVAPAAVYEEALSPKRSSRAMAADRARARIMGLADALPEGEGRNDIADIWRGLEQTREQILSTTERGAPGGRDIRNAANRAELWLAEFDAETMAREVLAEAGVEAPPYRNTQPRGSVAANLDALAWNPDESAADEARNAILAVEQEAESVLGADSTVTANLRAAREAAEENRVRFGRVAAQETQRAPKGSLHPDTEAAGDVTDSLPEPHLEGMAEPDRQAWRAGLASQNGRAADFQTADARLRDAYVSVNRLFDAAGDEETYLRAAGRYQDAWQEASRLLERVKREDDAIEEAFRAGATTLATDVMEAVRGGGEAARLALDAADESFRLPAIEAPEIGDVLGRTFGERNLLHVGRSYGEVADEIEAQVVTDKNRLLQLLARPGSSLATKEKTELTRLLRKYPGVETLSDAAALDVGVQFRRQLLEQFETEAGVTNPTRLGRAADAGSRIYSAVNLLMPWGFLRYYVGNLSGDTWQVLLAHGPQAAAAANDPRTLAAMTDYALRGGSPLNGAVGDLVKAAGLGGFHPALVSDNLAEAIWSKEAKAVNRAAGRARFNLIGGIDRATGAITNVPRNVANGLEWAHRTGLWAHLFRTNVVNAKAGFVAEMADLAAKHGIDEGTLRQVMEALPPVVDGAEVADSFGRLALARGSGGEAAQGFATEMGRRWASTVYRADEAALAGVNKALFSYEQTNIDRMVRRVVPFHMWMSRALPFYAEQALRHPGFAASYYRLYQGTAEAAEAEGWPAPLRTFARFWQGPGGMMLMTNPLAAVGLLDFAFESNGGYTPENVTAVGQVLNRAGEYGVSLLPWWAGVLNLTGYLGDSPTGLDPIGTHQARRFMGALVQLAAGEGWLGPEQQRLLDKPYERIWQDVRARLSGLLPGSAEIEVDDPNAMPAVQIRNILLRNELAGRGLTLNGYLQLVSEAERDGEGEAARLVAEIHDTVAAQEMDAGGEYQAAVRDWSRANAGIALIAAALPGPKRVRQADGLAIQSLDNSAYAAEDGRPAVIAGVGPAPGHDPGLALDARDREFVQRWAERFGTEYRSGDLKRMQDAAQRANAEQNAPPETAAVLEQQAAYHALGTPREQALLRQWQKIAYAEGSLLIAGDRFNRRGVRKGDVNLNRDELAALDQETRYDLADAWVESVDPNGDMQRLRELRDLYEETHPEFGAYQRWQRDTRKQWGSPAAFRTAAVRANPNYARYVNQETAKLRRAGKTASEIAVALDDAALSLDGYLAYTGMRRSRYDPMPLETGAPLPVASEGAPGGGGWLEAGGGRTWGERVYAAIRDTEAAMEASRAFLGVRLDELPPPLRDGYLASADYPDEARPPEDSWIYDKYAAFYAEAVANGTDPSVEAFVAATSRDENDAAPRYQPGVWPPQPAA